jgi:hypothetical protein
MARPKAGLKEGVGRPKAHLDWDAIANYLRAGVKVNVICAKFSVDYNTLKNRCQSDNNCQFSDFQRQKKSSGLADLQLAGFEAALSGQYDPKYTGALIFALKSRLGLSDRPKEDKGTGVVSITVNKGDENNA